MELKSVVNGSDLILFPNGRLDTMTSPDFLEAASSASCGMHSVTLDLTDLTYLSSAGLRVILLLKKQLGPDAVLRVENPCKMVQEVLKISCFDELLEG